MKKNGLVVIGLIATTVALALQGCGGGGSSSNVGKAYYVDSAVEGVGYKCGTQEGVTASDGGFNFQVGQGCEFYIGDYKFKEVSSAELKNGGFVVENDTKVAAILQTLDADGNPDNHITIKHSVAVAAGEVLAKEHTQVHTNIDGVLSDIVVKVNTNPKAEQEYHGHIVDEHSASVHLEKTKLAVKAQEEAQKHKAQAEKEAQNHKAQAEKEAQYHKDQAEKEAQYHKDQAEKEAQYHKDQAEKTAQDQIKNKTGFKI